MIYRGFNIDSLQDIETGIKVDLELAKSYGANAVRWMILNDPVAFYDVSIADYYNWYFNGSLKVLDACLPKIKELGLSVILDMHHPVGGFKNGKSRIFRDPNYEAAFIDIWVDTAKKYKDESSIIAYDLMNEPHPKSNKQWQKLLTETTIYIRPIDTDKVIIIEHVSDNVDNISDLKPIGLHNVWYSIHFYKPEKITFQGIQGRYKVGKAYKDSFRDLEKRLRAVDKFQAKYKVPIFVGEFACTWNSGNPNRENQFLWIEYTTKAFNARNWHWFWTSTGRLDYDVWKMGDPLNAMKLSNRMKLIG